MWPASLPTSVPSSEPPLSTHSVYYNSMGFFLALIYTTLIPSQGHLHLWSLLREHHSPLDLTGVAIAIIDLLKVLLGESPRSSC